MTECRTEAVTHYDAATGTPRCDGTLTDVSVTSIHTDVTCSACRDKFVKCAYCGKEGPWRTHSGVYECGPCWDWRKLDSAAARYWYILTKMVISSTDMYDLTDFFPKKIRLTKDEIKSFTSIIGKMHDSVETMAKEHHREDGWREQAQALFEQLETGIRPKPVPEHNCDENRKEVSGHGLRCSVCDRPILP